MTDTLILYRPLAEFGEALRKECQANDCVVYLNTYEMYLEAYRDYKQIKEAFPALSGVTIRALEHAIRKLESEMFDMWFENYAVKKQREKLGMAAKETSV